MTHKMTIRSRERPTHATNRARDDGHTTRLSPSRRRTRRASNGLSGLQLSACRAGSARASLPGQATRGWHAGVACGAKSHAGNRSPATRHLLIPPPATALRAARLAGRGFVAGAPPTGSAPESHRRARLDVSNEVLHRRDGPEYARDEAEDDGKGAEHPRVPRHGAPKQRGIESHGQNKAHKGHDEVADDVSQQREIGHQGSKQASHQGQEAAQRDSFPEGWPALGGVLALGHHGIRRRGRAALEAHAPL
mmetsp:Transcript_22821/g.86442  ORF Transcript_22821/g.86442 Transcript_22821/m.86442 type:complete len:250 (+) Transcript_22821:203-952(+)